MKAFFRKKTVQKFLFRWMVVNVVYLMIKATVEHEIKGFSMFLEPTPIFYYVTAFLFFMVTWEFNDRLILARLRADGLTLKNSLIIFCKTMLLLIPMTTIIYYLALFPLREVIGIECEDPVLEFRSNVFRAWLLATAVVFVNLFYFAMKQKEQLSKQMEDLQKEVMASQYATLKNQISPHFLFNNLNTLTALMYEDRDLASDFVARLAQSYRYILDHREHDLVPLEKEIHFLDAYNFMMSVRHKGAVMVHMEINVDPKAFFVPTLTLQMLVENALKHNLYSKEKPLRISVTTIQQDALAVKNNVQKRIHPEETTRMGLQNIKKRYAHYTNSPVLIREEGDNFEVIIPLLGKSAKTVPLKAIS